MNAQSPQGHPLVPLREVATFLSGGTPSKQNPAYWDGDIPWVSPKDMGTDEVADAEDHISVQAVDNSATKIVPPSSILVVVRSGILIRRLPVALTTRQVAFNQDIKALIVDQARCLPEYAFWWLKANEARTLAWGVKKGATVHSLSAGYLEDLRLPLRPLDEQRRIVDILNHAASIRRLREDARAKVREIIPALFVEMFGDPATNPKGWPEATVDDIAAVQGGLQISRKRETNPIEMPYLRVANVHRNLLVLDEIKTIRVTEQESQRACLETGDLLIVEGHGNPAEIGRVGLWDGSIPVCTHQNHLIRARCDQETILPTYLCAYLNSSAGRQQLLRSGKTTSGLNTISTRNVKSATVLLPPLSLQREFAVRVAEIEGMAALHDRAATAAEQMAQSLLSQVFDQTPRTGMAGTEAA